MSLRRRVPDHVAVSAWSLAVLLAVGTATASSPFGVNAHIPSTLLVDRVSDAGIAWARIDFVWAFVEPEQDVFDWELYDRVIGDLEARGIRIFATVAGTPAWATSAAEFSGPPDDPADWRDVCARAADRYRGRVAAWGMWNEPNLARFWTGSRDLYIEEILRPGAEAIRAADPGALVVGPDLAHLSSGDWDDWLRDVTIRGRDVLDVVVHHVYPSDDLASDVTDKLVSGDSFPFDRPSVREVLLRSGWWGRPFWLGETGVTSNPPNSENLQDRFYSDLLQTWFAPGGRDWVDRVFFYELADDPAIENAWGILGPPPDFVPKQAYATYREFIAEAGYDDAAIEPVDGPLFVRSQGEVQIVLSVRNTGTTTWSTDRGDRLHVSVNQLLWTIAGGELPDGREIRPGASVDIPVTVRVSSAFIDDPIPGLVVARMMDGNQSRFGDAATVSVILSEAPEPVGQSNPVTHIARPGASVRFAIEAAGDPETTTLQWRRNTIPLADDDRVSGAREPILTVAGVDASLAGVYDCLVTTSAGSIAVRAGRLRVVADEVTAADPRRAAERLTSVSARWRAWRFSTLRRPDVNRR